MIGKLLLVFVCASAHRECKAWICPFAASVNGISPITCAVPPAKCENAQSPYRTLDGSCYNELHPEWGMPFRRYRRLLNADYGDGYSQPACAISGNKLPSARKISMMLNPLKSVPDERITILNVQFGQFFSHDGSMLAGSTSSIRNLTKCCTMNNKMMSIDDPQRHPKCYPIPVPANDPLYTPLGVECLSLVRTVSDKDAQCIDNSASKEAEQLTVVTPWIDLSQVYGNSERECRLLRSFSLGRLATERRNNRDWPPSEHNKYDTCDNRDPDGACYRTGDMRSNQGAGLVIVQIVYLREHNRIADKLHLINPHWSDERLFQEARRINIGAYQHVVFYEWLPLMLGTREMLKYELIFANAHGKYVNDYDARVDPAPYQEHATVALRYFHTQIEGTLFPLDEERRKTVTEGLRLSNNFFRSDVIEQNDNYNTFIRGINTQSQQTTDVFFDRDIAGLLFRGNCESGDDLRSIDIQRSRDHGLPSYNSYLPITGRRKATKWEDFLQNINSENLQKLQRLYECLDDVELTVAGGLEKHVHGTLVGPTYLSIMLKQFRRWRRADPYFYENGQNRRTRFTLNQLTQLRKSNLARLFCDNSNVQTMQPKALRTISRNNQLQSCEHIQGMDLWAWKEHVTF